MRTYESIYILDPTLSADETETKINRLGETITTYGGKILKQDKWGARTLAYSIAKRSQGFYVVTVFEGTADTLKELDRAYHLDEQVLRNLTLVMDKKHLAAFQKALERAAAAAAAAATA